MTHDIIKHWKLLTKCPVSGNNYLWQTEFFPLYRTETNLFQSKYAYNLSWKEAFSAVTWQVTPLETQKKLVLTSFVVPLLEWYSPKKLVPFDVVTL